MNDLEYYREELAGINKTLKSFNYGSKANYHQLLRKKNEYLKLINQIKENG